jgi:uncharacterized protein (DUF1697 family)
VPRLVAFLRAINVGGHTVTMATLRRQFESLGFGDVETFIASGNVMFTSKRAPGPALERAIEKRLEQSLGFPVATFVRTAPELIAIAEHRAFPEAALRAAGAHCVGFLSAPLGPGEKKALAALRSNDDTLVTRGREVYWLCRKRQHESKFSNVVFERATGAKVTFRGYPTVLRLAAKARS